METIRLQLLGPPSIERDGQPAPPFKSRRVLALLAYLALNPGAHPRSKLAGLLWSDASEKKALDNLRYALWNLQRVLGGTLLQADRLTAALQHSEDLTVDVDEFQQALDLATTARDPNAPEVMAALQRAADLYRGDLLADLDLPGDPLFNEWLRPERACRREGMAGVLDRLGMYHTTRGELLAAMAVTRRLLGMESWREEAHRRMMLLLARAGQRSAALAQYETCRRLLAEELGVEPLEETTALYERILKAEVEEQEEASLRQAAPHLPFVGRQDEHNRLVTWWEAARRGESRLALVEGEAGVGKTRLVEEVIGYAELRGAAALRGRCYEFGGGVPYQPIGDALRSAPSMGVSTPTSPHTHASTLSPIWLSELSRLLPELREMRPDLPAPVMVSGEAARQRLFEAVARFLAAFGPCVLFLDDLQWADTSTLDLLHYLVRQLSAAPIWIVGTYRTEEVGLSHPLTRLRQGLSRDHLVDHLVLPPLSAEAMAEIAYSLIGEAQGAAFGEFLYRESEGNPLFLIETVSSLREQGMLRGEEKGRWQWAGPPAAEVLPTSVQDVVLQRVGRLSEPAQRLLTLAAVIGRQFDIPLLRAAAGPEAEAVDGSLREWLSRRLVRGVGSAYDFSHDKIRSVVYHSARAAQRRLHQRVGEAMEGLYAGQPETVCAQLAYHYERADSRNKARIYLPMAAARAAAVYANQEALNYYDRALALLEKDDSRRWEILLRRMQVLHLTGQYDEARAAGWQVVEATQDSAGAQWVAAQAANELSAIYRASHDYDDARAWGERARQLAEKSEEPAEQARAKQSLAEVERAQGNFERARRLFDEALALADRRGAAECLMGLGRVFSEWGQYDAARRRFEEALAVFQFLGDRQNESECQREIGLTHWRQGAYDAAHRAFAASLEICRAIGDRQGEAQSLNYLGMAYIARGDQQETRRCWEASVALYRTLGLEKQAGRGLHNLGILHVGQGDYAAAQQCLEEDLAIDLATGAKSEEAISLGWLGKLHLLRGAYDDARRHLEAAIALDREIGGMQETLWHFAWLGAAVYETGGLAGAKAHFQEAVRLAGEQNAAIGVFQACSLVALHLTLGDGAAALETVRQIQTYAETTGDPGDMGMWHSMAGAVHGSGLLADAEDATPYFEKALALLRHGDPFSCGVALRRYGAYLMLNDRRERGLEHLQESQRLFERIGARGELAKVTRLLAGDDDSRLRW